MKRLNPTLLIVIFCFPTYTWAQSYSMEEAVQDARKQGFAHLGIYAKMNAEAEEMQGNRTLDPLEFEYLRGEFNGPYPRDFQGLIKQNLGNGFDQIYLAKWNKSRREQLQVQLDLEAIRADVAVKQAWLDWQSAVFLGKRLEELMPQDEQSDFDLLWVWNKRHLEITQWMANTESRLSSLTGRNDLSSLREMTDAPRPFIRAALEGQVAEDFSLLEAERAANAVVQKWESRYALSQKIPTVWLGYYQLTIEEDFGYDGTLIQLDIPWASWFERRVKPIYELPEGLPDESSFEQDQRKVKIQSVLEQFENKYLRFAPELYSRAQTAEDTEKSWSYYADYVWLVSEYNKALVEWQLILQL